MPARPSTMADTLRHLPLRTTNTPSSGIRKPRSSSDRLTNSPQLQLRMRHECSLARAFVKVRDGYCRRVFRGCLGDRTGRTLDRVGDADAIHSQPRTLRSLSTTMWNLARPRHCIAPSALNRWRIETDFRFSDACLIRRAIRSETARNDVRRAARRRTQPLYSSVKKLQIRAHCAGSCGTRLKHKLYQRFRIGYHRGRSAALRTGSTCPGGRSRPFGS